MTISNVNSQTVIVNFSANRNLSAYEVSKSLSTLKSVLTRGLHNKNTVKIQRPQVSNTLCSFILQMPNSLQNFSEAANSIKGALNSSIGKKSFI
jgi:hypothetical protein